MTKQAINSNIPETHNHKNGLPHLNTSVIRPGNRSLPMAIFMHLPDANSVSAGYLQCQSPSKIFPYVNPRNVQIFKLSKDGRRDRIRVCSKVKDLEVKVSNLGQSLKPCTTTTPLKESKEDEEKQNYYLNTGDAIRTLREEIPEIFYRELSYNIYRDDIVFKDPLNTFHGIENYKSILSALRFNGKIFFKALWVDIVSVWQPVENMILIRWTIHGIPRVPWECRGRFDATSEYRLDKKGKIYEHRVHNIALNGPPKFHVPSMEELIHSIGCSSTPKPTCFKISSSSDNSFLPLSEKYSGVSDYVTSILRSEVETSAQK